MEENVRAIDSKKVNNNVCMQNMVCNPMFLILPFALVTSLIVITIMFQADKIAKSTFVPLATIIAGALVVFIAFCALSGIYRVIKSKNKPDVKLDEVEDSLQSVEQHLEK